MGQEAQSTLLTPNPKADGYNDSNKRPKLTLTPEQRRRIEQNRQRAIDIQNKNRQNKRDASGTEPHSQNILIRNSGAQVRRSDKPIGLKPSINKKDYIEYDFSTMKDTHGGFISNEDTSLNLATSGEGTSLEEWKEKQKREHVVRELAPPMDIANAPKCYECGSLEVDPNLYTNFNNVRVCRKCEKEKPEKYSLLTKTECREDYLLTDPELKDTSLLPRIEKPNPHGFSRMQLFLRFQVEEFAWKKWGSSEGLDAEWERRETMRLKRREKRYDQLLREMRKKTRAEEYTRKLRNGESIGERHVHDWSAPLAVPGESRLVKKRCIDCGVETEEMII